MWKRSERCTSRRCERGHAAFVQSGAVLSLHIVRAPALARGASLVVNGWPGVLLCNRVCIVLTTP